MRKGNTMGFFDRLAFGWRLGTTSLGVVVRDKTLMLFPILSGLAGLALIAAFVFGIGPENLKAAGQAQQGGGEIPPIYYVYAFAAYFGLSFIAVYFNVALIGAQKGVAPRVPGGLIFFLLVLLLLGPSISFVTDSKGVVHWWGLLFQRLDFTLASLIAFAAWAAFGAYRSMCSELQSRTMPWALAAFLGFMALYLAGFLVFRKPRTLDPVEAVLACGLGVSVLVEYLVLFAERSGPMTLRRLMARTERRQWRRALEELPGWPIALFIALVCAIGVPLFLLFGASAMVLVGFVAPVTLKGGLTIRDAVAASMQSDAPVIEPLDVAAIEAQLADADRQVQEMRATTADEVGRLQRLSGR